ncbi:MAG: hypothetical protein K5764_01865 [Prevotella sp.]|nr:hypothetical protein [Prevotella sp.]
MLKSGTELSDRQCLDIYKDLMWGYLQTNGKRSTSCAEKVLALSYLHNWQNARVDALRILGLLSYGAEHFDEAARYFEHALAVTDSMERSGKYAEKDIDDNRSSLYGSLGNLYNIQDKALLAIAYYQKALPIFEKYNWLESLTILHHNIAELYQSMGNNMESERHYLLAIEKGHASGDSLIFATPQKGLAKIYIAENKYEQALKILQTPYTYFHAHRAEEPQGYAETLAALARTHLIDGHENLTKAKAYAQEALSYDDAEMMTETRCDIYSAAAQLAMKEGKWQQALTYAKKAIHEDEADATFSDVGSYEMLANIYMQLGRKEEAATYINKVRTMMERFSTRHYQSGISQMEVLYDTEKKQEAIERLNRQHERFLWGAILLTVLLLLTAFTFFLLWCGVRLKKKSALFKAKFDGEVAERSRIARDLHDSIGSMLSVLRLKTESGAPKAEQLELLDKTATELRHVAHHLMPEQLLQHGLTTALEDLAIAVPTAHFQAYGTPLSLDKDQEIVLYRCAYELLHNALKHAQAERIDIQLLQEPHQVTLTVNDNGRGMTNEEKTGTGNGLHNIRERISHFKGHLDIITTEEKGTEIHVTLPL